MSRLFPRAALAVMAAATITVGVVASSPASAECYADYKAKQDAPLRLHYGVAQIADQPCDRKSADAQLRPRLRAEGWQLLNIMSTFGPEGLQERKANAGPNFLRY